VVIIFVEEGGNGGSVAAPIAKRIAQALNGPGNDGGTDGAALDPPEVKLIPPKTPNGED
jgi:hypothetical protein